MQGRKKTNTSPHIRTKHFSIWVEKNEASDSPRQLRRLLDEPILFERLHERRQRRYEDGDGVGWWVSTVKRLVVFDVFLKKTKQTSILRNNIKTQKWQKQQK